MTAFVVPRVDPSGNSVSPSSKALSRRPSRRFTGRESSTSVARAKRVFGDPGITRPATFPPWQARQFIDQRPSASRTNSSGMPSGSSGRSVSP
jgi:hypothetical protein